MLMPKRTKYRKMMRGRMKGTAHRGATIAFGEFALQALEPAWVSSRQIEAARRAITNNLKRGGKVWIRIFPDKPVTQKPAETRMGSGKGNPEFWVAVVKPGRVLFEIGGVSEDRAAEALKRAGMKMPMDCRFIVREHVGVPAAVVDEEDESEVLDVSSAPDADRVEEVVA
ncbi:MAG: LSU ribosomal protein L16p (L10e) [uncultured Thermomicrobiales bacterium]|uniref:Large ribosomal subunit protein uL16 n=1 Tax=uncultured Thermomicrobiales bacterium TaxID=1645740 RepID=A0A6J4UHW1_9BACT|nr:MAG: LSU ribosomal protein L16p (L10e) [uncultured Thermomicrobiales bacterium]